MAKQKSNVWYRAKRESELFKAAADVVEEYLGYPNDHDHKTLRKLIGKLKVAIEKCSKLRY